MEILEEDHERPEPTGQIDKGQGPLGQTDEGRRGPENPNPSGPVEGGGNHENPQPLGPVAGGGGPVGQIDEGAMRAAEGNRGPQNPEPLGPVEGGGDFDHPQPQGPPESGQIDEGTDAVGPEGPGDPENSRTVRRIKSPPGYFKRMFRRLKCWNKWLNKKLEPDQSRRLIIFLRELKLPGVKQMIAPNKPAIQRIIWFIAIVILGGFAVCMILKLLEDIAKTPALVNRTPLDRLTGDIPFLSFTIRDVNHITKSTVDKAWEIYETTEATGKPTLIDNVLWDKDKALQLLATIDHGCNSARSATKMTKYYDKKAGNEIGFRDDLEWYKEQNVTIKEDETYYNMILPFINQGMLECADFVPVCGFLGTKPIKCEGQFYPVDTDAGRACQYNGRPEVLSKRDHKTREASRMKQNYTKEQEDHWRKFDFVEDIRNPTRREQPTANVTKNEIPKRQYAAGKLSGFVGFIRLSDPNDAFCGSHDTRGILIAVHSSDDIPQMMNLGKIVPPDSEAHFAVSPEVILAEEDMEDVPKDKRGCCLGEECPKLAHTIQYTKGNCMSECIKNLVLEKCKCVLSYMPRNGTETLCGPDKYQCVEDMQELFLMDGPTARKCTYCMHPCNRVTYEVQMSSAPIQTVHNIWDKSVEWSNSSMNILRVFFNEHSIHVMVLRKTSKMWDTVSSIGGILGLFLDCTIISVLQILYAMIFCVVGYTYEYADDDGTTRPVSRWRRIGQFFWLFPGPTHPETNFKSTETLFDNLSESNATAGKIVTPGDERPSTSTATSDQTPTAGTSKREVVCPYFGRITDFVDLPGPTTLPGTDTEARTADITPAIRRQSLSREELARLSHTVESETRTKSKKKFKTIRRLFGRNPQPNLEDPNISEMSGTTTPTAQEYSDDGNQATTSDPTQIQRLDEAVLGQDVTTRLVEGKSTLVTDQSSQTDSDELDTSNKKMDGAGGGTPSRFKKMRRFLWSKPNGSPRSEAAAPTATASEYPNLPPV